MMQFRNPKYTAQGHIDCEILVGDEWLPTTVAPDDVEAGYDAAALFSAIKTKGGIEPYSVCKSNLADEVRAERNTRLAKTDWMALPDSPHYSSEILEYREALRNITRQPGFPNSVTWPELTVNHDKVNRNG